MLTGIFIFLLVHAAPYGTMDHKVSPEIVSRCRKLTNGNASDM